MTKNGRRSLFNGGTIKTGKKAQEDSGRTPSGVPDGSVGEPGHHQICRPPFSLQLFMIVLPRTPPSPARTEPQPVRSRQSFALAAIVDRLASGLIALQLAHLPARGRRVERYRFYAAFNDFGFLPSSPVTLGQRDSDCTSCQYQYQPQNFHSNEHLRIMMTPCSLLPSNVSTEQSFCQHGSHEKSNQEFSDSQPVIFVNPATTVDVSGRMPLVSPGLVTVPRPFVCPRGAGTF
jgi:hypothetical protein